MSAIQLYVFLIMKNTRTLDHLLNYDIIFIGLIYIRYRMADAFCEVDAINRRLYFHG